LLLWTHVATDKRFEVETTLPVTAAFAAENTALASAPPDSLVTLISATGKDLLRTGWRTAGLSLRIDETRLGVREIDLTPDNVVLREGEGIQLQAILSPRSYRVDIDVYSERWLPVHSRVTVQPAEGFAAGLRDSLAPSTVVARGPRAALERMEFAVTEVRQLHDVRSDFDMPVRVESNGYYGVTFEPSEVIHRVSVYAVTQRAIDSLPVALLNPPDESVRVMPEYITAIVAGAVGDIESVSANHISVTADYLRRSEDGSISIKVSLPTQLSLVRVSDSLVWVRDTVDGVAP
ncbi:MAG TPA: hypothetical protein VLB27_11140, partial [candidate division Zixibacteria bacterium]|nr:hypothetical protein [candidate division Zixibacteria bacterium]